METKQASNVYIMPTSSYQNQFSHCYPWYRLHVLSPLKLNAKHHIIEWHHTEHSRLDRVEMLRDESSVAICKRKWDILDEYLMPRYTSSAMI